MFVNQGPLSPPAVKPGALVFALLFMLDSFGRAMVVGVIPLQAKDLLLANNEISAINAGIAMTTMAFSLMVPLLIHRFKRRWVYTAGIVLGMTGVTLLGLGGLFGQVGGTALRSWSSAAINIVLMLYTMDFIPRPQMAKSEPLRLFMSCLAWGLGPMIGGALYAHYGAWAAAACSFIAYALLMIVFWYLRLTDNPAVAAATRKPPNPWKNLGRFISQPRLRLAWFMAFARSAWWSMFYVYPVIYLRDQGVADTWSNALLGGGNLLLAFTLPIGYVARKTGIRRPIAIAFLVAGLLTAGVAVAYDHPMIVGTLIMCAAFFIVVLDTLANIPFMRSVRPLERPQMTAIFRSYIDIGDLLPSLVYFVLLTFFDLHAVFLASATLTLAGAVLALRLPRSM